MISDLLNQAPKELVSESLKESLTQEDTQEFLDGIISVAFVPQDKKNSLIGVLVGVEFSLNPKLDIRASLYDTFSFISNILLNGQTQPKIATIVLAFGERNVKLAGPYDIISFKILEIDSINKTCVLAIDLIKNN